MKLFNKILATGLIVATGFMACEKAAVLPYYGNGNAPVLSSSVAAVTPAAGDSNKNVIAFSWTNPGYATNAAKNKYILQLDAVGNNFSKAVSREVTGDLYYNFLGKDLNDILLSYGYVFGQSYNMEARVISSYGNNNERLVSNVVRVPMTPYKIPPKVALPTTNRLFIVGDATQGGWGNPVPTPSQELTRIDETTFGGIFYLNGGGSYLILPENGQWKKYSVADNSVPNLSAGGSFGSELKDNFPGPQTDGWYRILLDFQRGTFTVTPFNQQHGLPQALVAVGGATPGGWSNNANNPQTFTRRNSTQWDITLNLKAGEKYLILPEPGNWGKKYGVEDNGLASAKLGGSLKPEGQDIPAPDVTADYRIVVDFINNSYRLTRQ